MDGEVSRFELQQQALDRHVGGRVKLHNATQSLRYDIIHDYERDMERGKARLDGGRLVLQKRDSNCAAFFVTF